MSRVTPLPQLATSAARSSPWGLHPRSLLWPALLALMAGALWGTGTYRPIFLWAQASSAVLPDAWWSGVTLLGHTCAGFALLSLGLRHQPQWVTAALLAALPASLLSASLKSAFDALRPAGVLEPALVHVIGQRLTQHSFPSGHSITAFALAAAVVVSTPRLRGAAIAAILVLATVVGWSRMAVGAHWPSDVLGGAAVGWFSGWLGATVLRSQPRLLQPGWQWLSLTILGGMGVSLFWVDSGYPLALPLQYALGGVTVLMVAWTAMQRLRGGGHDA